MGFLRPLFLLQRIKSLSWRRGKNEKRIQDSGLRIQGSACLAGAALCIRAGFCRAQCRANLDAEHRRRRQSHGWLFRVQSHDIWRRGCACSCHCRCSRMHNTTACTYTDTAVTAGQTYYYKLTFVVGTLSSVMSNEATGTIPVAPPTGVTAVGN